MWILFQLIITLGWSVSSAILITVFVGIHYFVHPDYQYKLIEATLFGGLHRAVFGFSIGWIIFACYINQGGKLIKIQHTYEISISLHIL